MTRDYEHLLPEDVAAEREAWWAQQDREAQRAEWPRPTYTHVPVTWEQLQAVINAAREAP
jgi:broad specificity phosphatase PhoE